MSFIARITIFCFLLAVLSSVAAASDGGDLDYGHGTEGAPGSDHSNGAASLGSSGRDTGGHDDDASIAGSSGNSDSIRGNERDSQAADGAPSDSRMMAPSTRDPGNDENAVHGFGSAGINTGDDGAHLSEPRDPGMKTGDRYTGYSDNQAEPGQKDQSRVLDTRPSRDDNEQITTTVSGKQYHSLLSNPEPSPLHRTSIPDYDEKNGYQSPRENHQPDSRNYLSGKPDQEKPGVSSKEDHPAAGERGVGVQEEMYTRVIYAPSVQANSGDSDRVTGRQADDVLFAHEKTTRGRTGADDDTRPALPLPAQVPNGEVPFANNPALPASGLPINAAAGTQATASTPTRSKIKGDHEPFWDPVDSPFVLSPWMLVKFWCFLGFRRVLKKNVLESDERKSLYESIMTHPGVDLSKLTGMLGLNKETARYHLKMLAANGKISSLIKQGIARYFSCREMISEFEKTIIHYLRIETTKRILLLLIQTPGLTRQAVARELGIAGPSVTWQMQRLSDDGLVEMRTEGRFVRYFLTAGSIDILESVKSSDGRAGFPF